MMRSLRCSAGLRRASWHSRLRNTRTLRLKAFFDIKFDVSSDAFPECFHFMEGELVEQLIFQRSADFIQRRELSLRPFIEDRKRTRMNSSHKCAPRMPSSVRNNNTLHHTQIAS